MRTAIKTSLQQLLQDKRLLFLLFCLLLFGLLSMIIVGLSIHPSDLQLISRYSAFGITHLYRDQWLYFYGFAVFPFVVAILHSIISVKLLVLKNRSLAILFAWIGILVIFISLTIMIALLSAWAPL